MTYQSNLRDLATYLDSHQSIAERISYDYPTIYVYADDWEEFQELIRDLDGYDKSGWNGSLEAVHRQRDPETGEMIFKVNVHVSGICEAVPKVDEDGEPVMRAVTQVVETGEMVQEMTYKCPDVWSRS